MRDPEILRVRGKLLFYVKILKYSILLFCDIFKFLKYYLALEVKQNLKGGETKTILLFKHFDQLMKFVTFIKSCL